MARILTFLMLDRILEIVERRGVSLTEDKGVGLGGFKVKSIACCFSLSSSQLLIILETGVLALNFIKNNNLVKIYFIPTKPCHLRFVFFFVQEALSQNRSSFFDV